jgi:hypothetical protein
MLDRCATSDVAATSQRDADDIVNKVLSDLAGASVAEDKSDDAHT